MPIYDYLHELPHRGYRCVTPILFGTMERQTHSPGNSGATDHCRDWLIKADKLGATLLALRLLDARLALGVARQTEGFDPERVASLGLSMGGELSLYLAAVEPEIRCCVCAGFFSTFEGLLMEKRNCHCYSIRDWPRWFDMPDLAGRIAPRPVLIQNGRDDPWIGSKDAAKAVRRLREIYKAFDAEEKVDYQTYPGEHCLHTELADAWLQQQFKVE